MSLNIGWNAKIYRLSWQMSWWLSGQRLTLDCLRVSDQFVAALVVDLFIASLVVSVLATSIERRQHCLQHH